METPSRKTERTFKTAWFSKAARKAGIKDSDLFNADDLGGGVFKKRLGKNLYRSIILAKGKRYWVYVYLFAKNDKENIENDELLAFRKLANLYAKKTDDEIQKELQNDELMEIEA